MNSTKKIKFSRIYLIILGIAILFMFYYATGNMGSSDYKYNNFLNDLKEGKVTEITLKQNKEVPTGRLLVKLSDKATKSIYVTDVNKVLDDIEAVNATAEKRVEPYIPDVSRDSLFLTTILPMLLLGVVVVVVLMMMNANASGGSGKMANFGN